MVLHIFFFFPYYLSQGSTPVVLSDGRAVYRGRLEVPLEDKTGPDTCEVRNKSANLTLLVFIPDAGMNHKVDEPHKNVSVVNTLRGRIGSSEDGLGEVNRLGQPHEEQVHQVLIMGPRNVREEIVSQGFNSTVNVLSCSLLCIV